MLFVAAALIYCNLKCDASGSAFVRAAGKKRIADAAAAVSYFDVFG